MHIVIAGASGATGRLLTAQAHAAGHEVTALVRPASSWAPGPGIRVLRADVVADHAVRLPEGTDVVISTLGKRSYDDTAPVCAGGVTNLLGAMRRQGVSRIVATSASPVLRSGAGEPWWFRGIVRPLVRRSGPNIYSDLEAMEQVLQASGDDIEWTVLRPGYLVDKPRTRYELFPEINGIGRVHRADLAAALLDVATRSDLGGRAFGLVSRPRRPIPARNATAAA
ncbi:MULTISPECIES: NAD(P)-dependent oxidoreductase [Microbacterium]|uniref:NAD(P)-dependent oxidoreductase n=1 Tax=Microbacterium TaxID=33882 RepID=UPI00217E1A4E|nr:MULTISPECIES: SDR family oxidoreductase [Microbacterium]UWF77451.1 NAD(P)H-binding protein [Microbacterium neungamense]WCM55614.1 NAD(P)H-binding protein [Microbacterium sp. EF45047]